MDDTYIIGTVPVPKWCRHRIMPYKKIDGTVGYEYYSNRKTYDMQTGERLELRGKNIYVIQKRDMGKDDIQCADGRRDHT